jgi:hypothetical protein
MSDKDKMTPKEALDEMVRQGEMLGLYDTPTEDNITPDAWVIIEIKTPQGIQFQKILAGWSGGYLYGDSWRMSSPVKELNIKINQDFFTVETESGSTYTLWKSRQGLRMSIAGIYKELQEQFKDAVEIIEL